MRRSVHFSRTFFFFFSDAPVISTGRCNVIRNKDSTAPGPQFVEHLGIVWVHGKGVTLQYSWRNGPGFSMHDILRFSCCICEFMVISVLLSNSVGGGKWPLPSIIRCTCLLGIFRVSLAHVCREGLLGCCATNSVEDNQIGGTWVVSTVATSSLVF